MALVEVCNLNTFNDANGGILWPERVSGCTEKLKCVVAGERCHTESKRMSLRRLDPIRL